MKCPGFFVPLIICEFRGNFNSKKKTCQEIAGLSDLFLIQEFQGMFYMSASFPFIMSGNN